jgi:hypothetical protein
VVEIARKMATKRAETRLPVTENSMRQIPMLKLLTMRSMRLGTRPDITPAQGEKNIAMTFPIPMTNPISTDENAWFVR